MRINRIWNFFALLQKEFLLKADKAIPVGGILLYCTCSLCHEEGENQISGFVQQHPNYQIINLSNKIPPEISNITTDEGFIRVLPHHLKDFGGADGFFIACLKKVS